MSPPARSRTAAAAAIVALALIALAAPLPPRTVEAWYSRGLYPPLQRTLTGASNVVPFALARCRGARGALPLGCARCGESRVRCGSSPALAAVAIRLGVFTAASYLVFLAVVGAELPASAARAEARVRSVAASRATPRVRSRGRPSLPSTPATPRPMPWSRCPMPCALRSRPPRISSALASTRGPVSRSDRCSACISAGRRSTG